MIEKKTYWTYKNQVAKNWFNLTSKDRELVKEDNTFEIRNDWFVLTTDQAKKLAELMATNQNTMAEKATAEFQKETMKKIINEIQQ